MQRVIHFEIHAEDPERALKFYEECFGWTTQRWASDQPYYLLTTGDDAKPGINGGLMRRRGPGPASGQPLNSYVCIIESKDLDADILRVKAAGATVALEKIAVPGVGYSAYFKDPEGNLFGLHQPDSSVKA